MHAHHHAGDAPAASMPAGPSLSRRAALGTAGAALSLAWLPAARAAVPFPQRLVIVNVRGGLDGLAAVIPYGDPALAGLRGTLLPPAVGQPGGMLDLGGMYALDPSLVNLQALYQAGQMIAVHAVGGILQSRSHFDDQAALQAGRLGTASSGWLNRLAGTLPTISGGVEPGMVLGSAMPSIAQGPVQFASWAHGGGSGTPNTLAALVETLGTPDPLIGGPIQTGFNDRQTLQAWLAGNTVPTATTLQSSMQAAGVFLANAAGPALALVETESVDTHTSQTVRLTPMLADLDRAIGLLASSAGPAWANTVVLTITEFGRTAYVNGSGGTDHGTAYAMFLAGGAVAGGRVIATWPGLAKLYQNRDLAPTIDMRAIVMGVLRDHLGLNAAALASVFPGAGSISPMGGLVTL